MFAIVLFVLRIEQISELCGPTKESHARQGGYLKERFPRGGIKGTSGEEIRCGEERASWYAQVGGLTGSSRRVLQMSRRLGTVRREEPC